MQQIGQIWTSLDLRKQVIVVLATLAMFGAVLGVARLASTPSMALLYAGLEGGSAGEIVSALEQRGVAYDVRGGSIFVDSARRDELRMTLASEGLPANSGRGYELLDGLSGFGTTSQMFDAAYWRAKEGELARTIVAHPSVRTARVHIATTGSNPFQRDVKPSASVAVTTNDGGVAAKHARAIQFLVAAAVTGLVPEDVSVIDSKGGLVSADEEAPADITDSRAEMLRQKVERLLAARVGAGNAVVEVSVDTVTRTETIRERRIDPESRVAISTDIEETSNSASDQGGDVTVASNLPQGDAAGGDNSTSESSETRERTNYEVSETERQISEAPGAISRLTVAVLLNGTTVTGADGAEVFEPRSEEELASLRELVASAVGFDEERGDVITLKTMEFQEVIAAGTEVSPSWLDKMAIDVASVVQAAILGIVALILGLFVLRPLLRAQPAEAGLPLIAGPVDEPGAEAASTALTGEIDDGDADPDNMSLVGQSDMPADLPDLRHAGGDPVERLRAMIGERQDETVEILRSWLESEEEPVK